jgi:hypothetical protein
MAITTNGGAGVTADAVATLTNKTLTAPVISDATFTGQQSGLQIAFNQTIVFEGTTADAFETTLSAGDPTADRVVTLPNETGILATQTYVDNIASGIVAKPAVLGATTANVAGTYNNGTAGVGATLTAASNGVFPSSSGGATGWAVGSGILLKNQTNKAENGRYFISNMGSVSTPYVLTRCSYCDEASEIPGAYIFVQAGTFAGTAWIQIVANPTTFVVGTDNIDVFQFAGTTGYVTTDGVETLTNKTLTSPVVSGLTLSDGSIVLEGATANDFETTLTVTDPTADRTITFPDSTGTVALTSGVINNSLTTTTGDTIYASSANTPARLAIGTEGQTLTVSAGGVPEWATPAAGTTANDQAFAFAVQVFA